MPTDSLATIGIYRMPHPCLASALIRGRKLAYTTDRRLADVVLTPDRIDNVPGVEDAKVARVRDPGSAKSIRLALDNLAPHPTYSEVTR